MNPSILYPLLVLSLLAVLLPRLRARVLLSRAKHRSIDGPMTIDPQRHRVDPG